jgi:hypothetical protein
MAVETDKTNTGVVATIVAVGAFAMISISALVTAMVRAEEADLDTVRPEHADLDTVAALAAQQVGVLQQAPHWVDRPAGKLGIPIERAKQLVLADYQKNPQAASPPLPPGLVLPPTPPDTTLGATPGAEPGAGVPAAGAPVGATPAAVAAPPAPVGAASK